MMATDQSMGGGLGEVSNFQLLRGPQKF